jgi:hypothetical protein
MKTLRKPSWACWLAAWGGCLLLCACAPATNQTGAQLLGLAVDGELPIDGTKLPLSATMPAATALAFSANLVQALGGAQAYNSVIAITKRPDHTGHDAVLIIDAGQGDDSIRGYRYTLQLQQQSAGQWQVVRAGKSWRCWPERGHQSYGSTPCA